MITVLVINSGNGVVATFTADNDGAIGVLVPAELPASISDRLLITIEDPQGNVTTFEKSEFVDPATGRTAVGPGGGTVQAADGSGAELRIPAGATDQGVVLKIESFQLEDLPEDLRQTPQIPDGQFGGGLRIESPDTPAFKKEVKLAFPLPTGLPENPQDAFFYVVRRVEGPPRPDGTKPVFFETIDQGVIEGEGEETKVVTASPPFSGYLDSLGGFGLGPTGQLLATPATTTFALLMWSVDQLEAGRPSVGVITGKVLRQKWNPGAPVVEYEPVEGAWVTGTDQQGNPLLVSTPGLPENVARSQKDGTFTLWDARYVGDTVKVAALIPGTAERRTAMAFQANPLIGDTYPLLRPYRNRATVTITFPAVEPPPPPPLLQIRVFRLEDGQRVDTSGLAVANQVLVIGFSVKNGEVRGATINGREYGVRVDPLFGSPTGMDRILDPDFTPAQPGSYTVTATAIAAFGPPITQSLTFRVVAEGGSNNDPLQDDPPAVITARTVPKKDATGVPVTVFPQVVFTEPVRNVPGNVTLVEAGGTTPVALKISGVGPSGPIEDLTMNPAAVVTSLTLQPMVGLKYGTKYTLSLTEGIQDLDTDGAGNPAPKSLVPVATSFTTFGPSAITEPGTGETFGSTGIVVLGRRAFLVENRFSAGVLRVFDVTDPAQPVEMDDGCCEGMYGRPVDIAGEEGTVVVAMSSPARSTPSSLYVFDVSNESKTEWVGVSSVTGSVSEGFINRIQVKDERVYVATGKKGVQVVDVAKAREVFKPCCGTDYWRMLRDLATDGLGFGREAVVGEVEVKRPPRGPGDPPQPSMLYDLEVGDFALGGQPTRLVVSTGFMTPLVIVDPQAMNVVWQGTLQAADGSAEMTTGQAIGLGRVTDRDIAVVTGSGLLGGVSKPLLATVSLEDPSNPEVLGFLDLSLAPCLVTGDVLVKDQTAYVSGGDPNHAGCVLLVSLDGPRPTLAGMIPGIGGRLALGEDGILYASGYSQFGQAGPLGGVRTAALGNLAIVEGTDPARVVVGEGPLAAEQFKLKYRVIPSDYEVTSAKLKFWIFDSPFGELALPLPQGGRGELTLPLGYEFPRLVNVVARTQLVVNQGTDSELVSARKSWDLEKPEIELVWGDRDVDPDSGIEVKDEIVTTDYPRVGLELVSPEWFRRFEAGSEDPVRRTKGVDWTALGPQAAVDPVASFSDDGFFEATLNAGAVLGDPRAVTAKRAGVVLGSSEPVLVEPGAAAQVVVTATNPENHDEERTAVCADLTSEVLLTAEARDARGNLVADGTAVVWEKGDNATGGFFQAQEKTQNGRATVRYRAGGRPSPTVILKAHVDEAVGEVQIRQVPVGLGLIGPTVYDYRVRQAPELRVTVDCAVHPVPDGVPVGWLSSVGIMEETQPVTNGEGKAIWHFGTVIHRPRVDFLVTLGEARNAYRMRWLGPAALLASGAAPQPSLADLAQRRQATPGGGAFEQSPDPLPPAVTITPMMIAGDRSADGEVAFPRSDGTLEQVPVRATATYRVEGLVQGERVTVRLGTNAVPNLAPVLHYSGDDVSGGVVPDLTGLHDGTVTGGVAVGPGGYTGNGFQMDGTGLITVPHHQEFDFSGPFMVQLAVRPPPESGAQALLEKSGDYRLALVEVDGELHARFTVATAGGAEESITSVLPVPRDSWSLVTGRYESGRLWVGVGSSDDFTLLSNPPVHSSTDLLISPGFTGSLDEVRIFDQSKTPLSQFANGQQTISFLADGTGVFETQIISTGVLGLDRRVAAYYRGLPRDAMGLAADEPFPNVLGQEYGATFTQAHTFWDDRAESAETDLGYVTATTMAFFAKFGQGVALGSEGETDPTILAGDIAGSFFLIGFARDFVLAAERTMEARASAGDALDVGSFLLIIVEKAIKKKAQLLRAGVQLAKRVTRGGRASRVLARLLAYEAKLEAGVPGVPKIRKLLQMAQGVSGAAQLIGFTLDWMGDDEQAVEQLNVMLDNAINSEEVLDELATFPVELVSPEEGKLFLQAVGTPIADGAPSQGGSTVARFARMIRPSMRGVKFAGRVLKDQNLAKEAKTLAGKIKSFHPNEFEDIFKQVDNVKLKVDSNKTGFLSRLLRQLGSNSPIKRQGAVFVLRVADSLPVQQARIIFEKFERIASATGRTLRRFPDMVVGDVWYECKNWLRWTSFPPNPILEPLRMRALKTAEWQFLKSLVAKGQNATGQLKFVLPKGKDGMDKFATSVQKHFYDLLQTKKARNYLKRHMVGASKDPGVLTNFNNTLTNVTRDLHPSSVSRIIEYH